MSEYLPKESFPSPPAADLGTPSFINAHLNLNQNKTSNNTHSILLRHCPKDPTVERYSLLLDNDSFLEHSKPQLPVQSLIECF
ncbi:hypothetical protein DVH24_031134 [Malus domestica]|uniref:Uncharacterized protein n=1 Tax=Malus domestica TaxID=3750 RepID=A0A498HI55_MALDO|nr:hypothetical protein DVH24_031134 [Malus domestica]